MIYFVGAGPGAEDLITVRGQHLLQGADIVIYAGSLVNPALLRYTAPACEIYDSARMTLEQVLGVMKRGAEEKKEIVRLHTGDPCLYGAVQEQMDALDALGIGYEVCPGVSSFCGAAAALKREYTLPGLTQSVIISRVQGRTAVPERESLEKLSSHGASMVLFLSAGLLEAVQRQLLAGGYKRETPCAIVYKATWADEKIVRGKLGGLAELGRESGIGKMALVLVGDFLGDGGYERSRLYAPDFSTNFRKAKI